MEYESPVSELEFEYMKNSREYSLMFVGDFGELLEELKNPSPLELALHPPRIIRTALDYKIAHPEIPEGMLFFDKAVDIALRMYKDSSNVSNLVDELWDYMHEIKFPRRLPVKQRPDKATQKASDSARSSITAERLRDLDSELLFIALGHGGIMAGMDVYLNTGLSNSVFHPVRLSKQKLGDKKPRITPEEEAKLKLLEKGRKVIIFDEDLYTGNTMKTALEYFSGIFHNEPITEVNYRAPRINV